MTRIEAINFLKGYLDEEVYTEKCRNAHEMAIKALEQEPCEDAVSKASVFEIMGNLMSIPYDFDRQITEKDVSESMDEIRALPPVAPAQEPKTGHWIIIDDCERFIAKCSQCGRIEDSRMISKYPFCHCGAKMEGE